MGQRELSLVEIAIKKLRRRMANAIAEYQAEERRLLKLRDVYAFPAPPSQRAIGEEGS